MPSSDFSIPPAREVHISSLVVQSRPDRVGDVATRLDAMPDTEVHRAEDSGKLVILLETASRNDVTGRVDAIRKLPDVVNVTLVYHQIEDAELLDQPVQPSTPPV